MSEAGSVTQWLTNHYDLLRGLHILAVIAWMSGMLYLPRLYVYHTRAEPGSEMDETFKTMEVKLLRIIINPSMVLAFVFGLGLLWVRSRGLGADFFLQAWVITKMAGVVAMASWHGFLAGARKAFATGTNTRSEKFWRLTNEIPFVLAIIMVLAVTLEF
jgi:putative membrane protein